MEGWRVGGLEGCGSYVGRGVNSAEGTLLNFHTPHPTRHTPPTTLGAEIYTHWTWNPAI